MRRLLVILMISLLPFQFVWGAAASYCQHEQVAGAVQHFGHHLHKHQGKALKAASQSVSDHKSAALDDDPDCATCHLSCVSPLMQAEVAVETLSSGPVQLDPVQMHPPHVPYVIERPNWPLAV